MPDYVEDYEQVTGKEREAETKVVEAPAKRPKKAADAKVETA